MGKKYVTFSFDDGEIFDLRLVDLLNEYNMKATFFIITDKIGETVPYHRYGKDTVVQRTSEHDLKTKYKNMEIASHTSSHKGCVDVDSAFMSGEIDKSFQTIEKITGSRCAGLAYPGGAYDEKAVQMLRERGVLYARTINCTYKFSLPNDFLRWNPTCKVDDAACAELAKEFAGRSDNEDILLNIYGHSYEFDNPDRMWWTYFENSVLKPLSNAKGVCAVTYGQLAASKLKGLKI